MKMKKKNLNRKLLRVLMNKIIIFLLLFSFTVLYSQTNEAPTNRITTNQRLSLSSNINFQLKNKKLTFPFILKFKSYKSDPVKLNILNMPASNSVKKVKIVKNKQQQTIKKKKKKTEEDVKFNIALSLFKAGEFEKAKAKFEELATASSGSAIADKSYFYISRIYVTNHNIPKAIENLNNILLQKPKAELMKIRYHLLEKSFDEAISIFSSMAQLYPKSPYFFKAAYYMAPVYADKKIGKTFVGLVSKKPNKKIENSDYLIYALALVYENDSKIRDIRLAHSYYKKITTEYPDSPLYSSAVRKAQYLQDNFLNIK